MKPFVLVGGYKANFLRSLIFRVSRNNQTTGYPINITGVIGWWHHSLPMVRQSVMNRTQITCDMFAKLWLLLHTGGFLSQNTCIQAVQHYKVDQELVQNKYPHFNKNRTWGKYSPMLNINRKNTRNHTPWSKLLYYCIFRPKWLRWHFVSSERRYYYLLVIFKDVFVWFNRMYIPKLFTCVLRWM